MFITHIMTKAYSYLRFSTPEQIKGDSQTRQLEGTRGYCKEHNLTLVEEYQDLGLSAFKGAHRQGALGDFLDILKSGRIDKGSYLIVESLDRLSREGIKVALTQFLDILNNGVNIATLTDNKVYLADTDSSGELMDIMYSIMTMSRANEESLTKSKRVQAAWDKKQIEAQKSGKPKSARCPAWLVLRDDRSAYDLVEDRAKVVRRIFKLTIDGQGKRTIADLLNSEGVPVFGRGKYWHDSYITKMLNNKSCIGLYEADVRLKGKRTGKKMEGIENYFPAAVDEATFYKAAQVRRLNDRTGGPQRNFANMYQGFCYCNLCGGPMMYISKNDRDKYLKCRSYHSKQGCKSGSLFRYKILEVCLFNLIATMDLSPLFGTSKLSSSEDEIAIKKGLLESKKKTKEDLLDNFDPSMPGMKERILKLDADVVILRRDIESLESQVKATSSNVTEAHLKQLVASLDISDQASRKKLNTWLKSKVMVNFIYHSDYPDMRSLQVRLKGEQLPNWEMETKNQVIYYIQESGKGQGGISMVKKVSGGFDSWIQGEGITNRVKFK